MISPELPFSEFDCPPESGEEGSSEQSHAGDADASQPAELGLLLPPETTVLTEHPAETKQAGRQLWVETGCIPPLDGGASDDPAGRENPTDGSNQHEQYANPESYRGWKVRGRGDFNWQRDLSGNGQRLYKWLLYDMGDMEYLPLHAAEEGWDLETALSELRMYHIIDESDPRIISLK